MLRPSLLVALLVATAHPATAQVRAEPFGLRDSLSYWQLWRAAPFFGSVEGNPGFHKVIWVPTPYPSLDEYWARESERTGVCEVFGADVIFENERDGMHIKDAFRQLHMALLLKYGKEVESTNTLKSGSAWSADSNWTESLKTGDRELSKTWTAESQREGHPPFPVNVESITLYASMTSANVARVLLRYRFTNFPSCKPVPTSPKTGRAGDAL